MTPEQRYHWRVALELKLRRATGDAFQDFFSVLMGKAHGSDFVRVRPFGALGDKGCDGYQQSNGKVFQCYGALNGDGSKVATLIDKMDADFAKALAAIPAIMKQWNMVHNLVDGLPIHAVEKLAELKKANPKLEFGFIGYEGFEQIVFALPEAEIEALLGVVASSQDAQSLQVAELKDLVAAVASTAEAIEFDVATIKPVPSDKLDINNLPGHWRSLIAGGWQNAHLVGSYLSTHPNPLVGETIAQAFRAKYQYLKAQGLSPSAIMSALYDWVCGPATVTAGRQVAVQALLAYLFESCDIFEDVPTAPAEAP